MQIVSHMLTYAYFCLILQDIGSKNCSTLLDVNATTGHRLRNPLPIRGQVLPVFGQLHVSMVEFSIISAAEDELFGTVYA
jgi:hypothetical protein